MSFSQSISQHQFPNSIFDSYETDVYFNTANDLFYWITPENKVLMANSTMTVVTRSGAYTAKDIRALYNDPFLHDPFILVNPPEES